MEQYCLKTGLLPTPVSPTTVTFQPEPVLGLEPVVSLTVKLFIVALVVWAWPLSATVESKGVSGATSKANAPVVFGLKPIVVPSHAVDVGEIVNDLVGVAPAVAWMKSALSFPILGVVVDV